MERLRYIAQVINTDKFPKVQGNENTLQTILNIIFSIMGAAAIVIILIAGMQYIFSQGDSAKIMKAKQTIFYAFIGLAIIAFATVIVNFVLNI